MRGHRPTALLAETWRLADEGDRERLGSLLGRRDPDEQALAEVRAVMRRVKAPDRIEAMIADRVEEALAALHTLNAFGTRRGCPDRTGALRRDPSVLTLPAPDRARRRADSRCLSPTTRQGRGVLS